MAIILRLPQVCSSLLWVRMLARTALPRSLTLFSLSRHAALPPDPSQAAVTRTHAHTHACTRRGEQGKGGREGARKGGGRAHEPRRTHTLALQAHSARHALAFRHTHAQRASAAAGSAPSPPPPPPWVRHGSRHAHTGQAGPDQTRPDETRRDTHFLLHADI